jgi:hypothetical protein
MVRGATVPCYDVLSNADIMGLEFVSEEVEVEPGHVPRKPPPFMLMYFAKATGRNNLTSCYDSPPPSPRPSGRLTLAVVSTVSVTRSGPGPSTRSASSELENSWKIYPHGTNKPPMEAIRRDER